MNWKSHLNPEEISELQAAEQGRDTARRAYDSLRRRLKNQAEYRAFVEAQKTDLEKEK